MSFAVAMEKHPRVSLGHWPTPVEQLPRLGETLGHNGLYVKRDDCSGLGFGGNKVRKLEYLVAQAMEEGADTLITAGAVQTNHGRQTAAAAAKCGLACHLILPRMVPNNSALYESSGNVLLDHLFGAQVHIVNDADAALSKAGEIIKVVERKGGKAHFIPPGGSNATGSLGFVRAALELGAQERDAGLKFDRIILAASTAGTLAGLAVGFAAFEGPRQLDAVMVYEPSADLKPKAETLLAETAEQIGIASPGFVNVTFHDAYLGEGYGLPTDAMREALSLMATKEGIALDPAYTGKAFAGLIDLLRRGDIDPDENVLFWHTGGAPALFAQPENI